MPLLPEIAPEPLRTSDDVLVYQAFYSSLDDVRIAAWYCCPARANGPSAAILSLPGYQMDPPIPDRHTYGYRGFYVDAWRGVDVLLSRAEVDPMRIGVHGNSQGGGLTITTAAMRPEIRAAAAGAPYLCGFMDSIALTSTYPYEEIADYLRLHPERRREVEDTVAYFDGINFADRITCPIIVNVGLQDNVCPPETGYALFERIRSTDKRLYPYDGHGHNAGRYLHQPILDEFFARHLGKKA